MKTKEDKKYPKLKELRKAMKECQDAKRYQHTVGVEYTAASLAMCYGEDVLKAQIAGILHDSVKCMEDEKKLAICAKYKIPVSDVERRNPFLLHSKVGAFLAQKDYGIDDEDILNAINYHTTGRPNMSLLEKIVFIADYIEPGRNKATNLDSIRPLAFHDIDKAMVAILKDTLEYLKQDGNELDPMTQMTYDYYMKGEN